MFQGYSILVFFHESFFLSIDHLYYKNEHIKTNLLEEYVNFVDSTNVQNRFFKIGIFLIANIVSSFLCYLSFKYLND